MTNKCKKLLSLAICLMLAICLTSAAFADTSDGNQYIRFDVPQTRIDSNGNFSFQIAASLVSDDFKIQSANTTTTISVYATLLNGSFNPIYSTNCEYRVTLQHGFFGITDFSINAVTGKSYSGSSNSLDPNATYRMLITKSGSEGYYVEGTGTISNFGYVV